MSKYWSDCSQSVRGATRAQHRPSLWRPLKRAISGLISDPALPSAQQQAQVSPELRLVALVPLNGSRKVLEASLRRYLADTQVGMWVHTFLHPHLHTCHQTRHGCLTEGSLLASSADKQTRAAPQPRTFILSSNLGAEWIKVCCGVLHIRQSHDVTYAGLFSTWKILHPKQIIQNARVTAKFSEIINLFTDTADGELSSYVETDIWSRSHKTQMERLPWSDLIGFTIPGLQRQIFIHISILNNDDKQCTVTNTCSSATFLHPFGL